MAKTVWIALGASICLLVAYWCHIPLPPGTDKSIYYFLIFNKILSTPQAIIGWFSKYNALLCVRHTTAVIRSLITIESHPLIEDTTFDGLPVRVFGRRAQRGVTYAAIVHFHAGGWMTGSIDHSHQFLWDLWNDTNVVIVSVEHRLAPEHVFPAAFDDGRRAVFYLIKNAARFHVDPKRISVAGDSSGSNVAAAVALWWRDQKISPPLSHQLLGCPPLQATDFNTRSYTEFADLDVGVMGCRAAIGGYWLMYLLGNWTEQDHADVLSTKHVDQKTWDKYVSHLNSSERVDAGQYTASDVNERLIERLRDKITDPYAAPLAADSLKGLPPTLILSGARDVLRTEAEVYARRLRRDGVDVTRVSPVNSYHCDYMLGADNMGVFRSSVGAESLKLYKNYIKKNL